MGNKKSRNQSASQSGTIMNDTKKILLLHHSSPDQLKVVRKFRDALVAAANGSVRIVEMFNIANGGDTSKDRAWLEEMNNLILICLTREAIPQLENVIRRKRFTDENDHLHKKVFTVSFGGNLAAEWPPQGMERNLRDVRDFTFGFEEVGNLRPQDFERSETMTTLVAALKGTN